MNYKNPIIGSFVRFEYGFRKGGFQGQVIDSHPGRPTEPGRYWIVIRIVKFDDERSDGLNRIISVPVGGQDDAVATVIAP